MITITNNNIYYTPYSLLDINSIENVKIVNPKDIVKYLSDNVEFGESLKFKTLFDIVSHNVSLFNQIFYKSLGGFPLGPYLQEIENNKTEDCSFDYIELCWQFDNYDNDLDIYTSLHGISDKEEISYALDFVSLNNIKDYIIKMDKKFYYNNYTKIKKGEKKINHIIKYLGDRNFTLFDLYESIFNEISFHGGPQDKKEIFDELQESIDDAKSEFSEGNLENYKSFEDFIYDFENNDIYLVKYNDDRCSVDKNRISNEKNLEKLKNCLFEKMKIYDKIKRTNKNLHKYYKKLTDIEYNMQLLYGEDEDISKHKFWETPKCTCPKIDNIEIYPSDNPKFAIDCPIHSKQLN